MTIILGLLAEPSTLTLKGDNRFTVLAKRAAEVLRGYIAAGADANDREDISSFRQVEQYRTDCASSGRNGHTIRPHNPFWHHRSFPRATDLVLIRRTPRTHPKKSVCNLLVFGWRYVNSGSTRCRRGYQVIVSQVSHCLRIERSHVGEVMMDVFTDKLTYE